MLNTLAYCHPFTQFAMSQMSDTDYDTEASVPDLLEQFDDEADEQHGEREMSPTHCVSGGMTPTFCVSERTTQGSCTWASEATPSQRITAKSNAPWLLWTQTKLSACETFFRRQGWRSTVSTYGDECPPYSTLRGWSCEDHYRSAGGQPGLMTVAEESHVLAK